MIVFISSKISLVTKIEPITACSASTLFGNSLNLSLTILKLFSLTYSITNISNRNLKKLLGKRLYNYWILSADSTISVISASTSECNEIFTLNSPIDFISLIGCIIDGLIFKFSF